MYTIKANENGYFYSVLDEDGENIATDCERSDAQMIAKSLNGMQQIKKLVKGISEEIETLAMAELMGDVKLAKVYKVLASIQKLV